MYTLRKKEKRNRRNAIPTSGSRKFVRLPAPAYRVPHRASAGPGFGQPVLSQRILKPRSGEPYPNLPPKHSERLSSDKNHEAPAAEHRTPRNSRRPAAPRPEQRTSYLPRQKHPVAAQRRIRIGEGERDRNTTRSPTLRPHLCAPPDKRINASPTIACPFAKITGESLPVSDKVGPTRSRRKIRPTGSNESRRRRTANRRSGPRTAPVEDSEPVGPADKNNRLLCRTDASVRTNRIRPQSFVFTSPVFRTLPFRNTLKRKDAIKYESHRNSALSVWHRR